MRRALALSAFLVPGVAFTGPAAAQEATASGSLGAGIVGPHPATLVDVGIDVAGREYAVGLGGRVRYLPGRGLRTEDWDEASELLGLVRYATYGTEVGGEVEVRAAAGELGGARIGHGTVMAGYASGISLDHGHFGAQARLAHDELTGDVLLDDLADPRIVGLRAGMEVARETWVGVSFAADLSAPAMGGPAAVGLAAVDVERRAATADDRYRGRAYADAVGAAGLGAGLHTGLGGSAAVGDDGARIGARGELRLSAGGYVPGWFGPLYERDRAQLVGEGPRTQLDVARMGGLGGAGGLGELTAEVPGVGAGALQYASRPGLADQALVRLEAPYLDRVQGAVWGALAVNGPGEGAALAAELRVRLPERMTISADLARLYGDREGGGMAPVWTASVAVGAVLGE